MVLTDIDQVGEHGQEDHDHCHSEGETGDDGDDPVDGWLSRPGEPEKSDGEHDTGDTTEGKTGFGREGSTVLDEVSDVTLVFEDVDDDGGDHSESDSNER